MKNTIKARQIYAHFRQLPGSEYIATEHAIAGLIKWLKKKQPRAVLEVGAGIGTLTFSCIATLQENQAQSADADFRLISIEGNRFCQAALKQNLKDQWNYFELVEDLSVFFESGILFDFVLIDGGEQDPVYVTRVAPRGIIFIEGYMGKKHELIATTHHQRSYAATNFRSSNRKASYWIYQFEPHLSERLWFQANNFYNRVWSFFRRFAETINEPQHKVS